MTRGGGGAGLGSDACATPRIVEFLNLEDNTAAVTSTVRLDEPLFQPYPSKVVFEGYEPFGQQQKVRCVESADESAVGVLGSCRLNQHDWILLTKPVCHAPP